MKKLLSFLLAICLCAVCFVGCDKVDDNKSGGKNALKIEDVKKDPYGALQEASKDVGGWAKDDAEVAGMIKSALESGSVELYFASEALFSMMGEVGLESVKGTLYTDEANKKEAVEIAVGMNGETLGGILYANENGIALSSEILLLSSDTYLLDFSKLFNSEIFGASALPTLMQIPADVLPDVLSALDVAGFLFNDALTWDWETMTEQALAGSNAAVNYSVSNGTIKDASGKNVSCAVISVTTNEESVKATLMAMIDAISIPESLLTLITGGEAIAETQVKAVLKMQLAEAFENGTITLDVDPMTEKHYISLKTGKLVGTEFISTTVDEEYDFTYTSTMTVLYTENGIVWEMMDGEYGYRATLAKGEKNGTVSYALTVDAVFGNMKQTLAGFNASYNKASGALLLSASVWEGPSFEIGGALIKTETEAAIAFNSLKLKDFEIQPGIVSDLTIDVDLSLTFKAGTPVPEMPAETTDLVTLSEEEWGALIGNVMNSPVAQLIGNLMAEQTFDYKKPSYIPEGMVEEEYWVDEEGACFGYGYPTVEDDYEYVNTQYCFTAYATEELYQEEIDSLKEYYEIGSTSTTPVAGHDVLMISAEGYLYMFWTDGEGFYSLDIYDTQFDAGDIVNIIASVE